MVTAAGKTIEEVASDAGPAVVGLVEGSRAGSGAIVGEGQVLTLARNLRGAEVGVALAGGRRETARVAAVDEQLGVALLLLDSGEAPVLEWAEPGAPAIGAPVFALADPAGRGLRVTAGTVASDPRLLRGPRGGMLEGLIEHTAPLPRGSAGGPLLDAEGRLLGINALRPGDGLILALPAWSVRERVADLAAGRTRSRPRLGATVLPPRVARRLRAAVGLPAREGVLVRGVQEGSPAAAAGLERGDLIVSLAGREVDSVEALLAALEAAPAQRPAALGVVRGAEERELELALERS